MSSPSLQSPAVLSAAHDFVRRVALAWPLQSAMLFGSQARGSAHVGSDTDVAVLLQGHPGDFVATKLALDDVAYDVLLDSGIRIPAPAHLGRRMGSPRELQQPALAGKHCPRGLGAVTAQELMAKAERALASAQLLLDSGDVDGACNRAY